MNRAPLDLVTIYRVLELGPVPTPPPTLLELQSRVKRQRRILARRYHPDVTGADDARMQEVNRVADHVERSEVLIVPPGPARVDWPAYTWHTTTTTSNPFATFGWNIDLAQQFANFIHQDQAKRRARAEKILNERLFDLDETELLTRHAQ